MILSLIAVAAGLAAAQTQVVLATEPVTNATGTVTSTTSPVVGVTTTTLSLTTAPLSGATTGLGAPTNAPGASFTPPGAVPQGFNGVGAPFTQPGTLTPQIPPNTTPPPPPTQPTVPAPTNPSSTPSGAPKKQTRADTESTRAALQLDQENVERHRRLHEQFLARRKILTDSDDWKFSSWSERRAQLKALRREYDEREAWLREDYLQKREGLIRLTQGG